MCVCVCECVCVCVCVCVRVCGDVWFLMCKPCFQISLLVGLLSVLLCSLNIDVGMETMLLFFFFYII